jgi:hypothetical protein
MAETRETRKSRGWDPLQSLRELLDQGERSLNEVLAERSASERRNALRGRVSNLLLDAQKRNWEMWARWFQTINLPTRTDVIRLGKVLTQLEQRMSQLESGLKAVERRVGVAERASALPRGNGAAPVSDRPRPARTRRPPSRAGEEQR